MRPCPFGGSTPRSPGAGAQRIAQLITENLRLRKQVRSLEQRLARLRKVCQDTHQPIPDPPSPPRLNGSDSRRTTRP